MGKNTATVILDSRLAVIRQWDKKEAIEYLLPRYVKDGKMYNFKDQVIMSYDGEDCVFHEDVDIVKNISRVTDKFLNEIYLPYNKYLGTASEQAKGPEITEAVDEPKDEEVSEDKKSGKKDKKKSKGTESDGKLFAEIKSLIKDGDLKKAKKLLKKNEDAPDYKACKKLIKKAGK